MVSQEALSLLFPLWNAVFPLEDTLWRAFVVLLIILAVPFLMNRIRFPQIAGLIITGMLMGPGGFDILESSDALSFFSSVGLLMIMFFAGLGIDIEEMRRTKALGITFGVITFLIPWLICFAIGTCALHMDKTVASIICCVLGSHTLISYPIISRHGLSSRKSVAISVSGALVAIVLALITYAYVQASSDQDKTFNIWHFIIYTAIYVSIVIFLFPVVIDFFFKKSRNSNSHFLFVLMILALSCGIASLAGLEGILGAFLAGIVFNRYIPKSSPLMNRLDFIGNTLFIPTFLFNTGMLIRPDSLVGDSKATVCFIVLFTAATLGKWIPAYIIQKAGKMERGDRMILFGLSESHAAGALAITMGAYSANILDNTMFGIIVLIVLFSCIVSNILTESGSRLILKSNSQSGKILKNESILVCFSGPETRQSLMDASLAIRNAKGRDELVGLHITVGGEHTYKYMSGGKDILLEAQKQAVAAEVPFQMQNRVGNNITASITHAAEEFESTQIIAGLTASKHLTARYYENIIRPLVDNCSVQLVFLRLTIPINTIQRMMVLVPDPIILDFGLKKSLETLRRLSSSIGCVTDFYGKNAAIDTVRGSGKPASTGRTNYYPMSESADMNTVIHNANSGHLLVLMGQRDSETHAGRSFLHLYERLHLMENKCSIMIIYPEKEGRQIIQSLPSARTDRDLLKLLRI